MEVHRSIQIALHIVLFDTTFSDILLKDPSTASISNEGRHRGPMFVGRLNSLPQVKATNHVTHQSIP